MLLTFAVGDHWTLWKVPNILATKGRQLAASSTQIPRYRPQRPEAFQDWESCLEEAGLSKVRLKMKRTGQIRLGLPALGVCGLDFQPARVRSILEYLM